MSTPGASTPKKTDLSAFTEFVLETDENGKPIQTILAKKLHPRAARVACDVDQNLTAEHESGMLIDEQDIRKGDAELAADQAARKTLEEKNSQLDLSKELDADRLARITSENKEITAIAEKANKEARDTFNKDFDTQWNMVKDLPLNGTQEKIKSSIEKVQVDGNIFGTVSFTSFGPVQLKTLQERIKLEKSDFVVIDIEPIIAGEARKPNITIVQDRDNPNEHVTPMVVGSPRDENAATKMSPGHTLEWFRWYCEDVMGLEADSKLYIYLDDSKTDTDDAKDDKHGNKKLTHVYQSKRVDKGGKGEHWDYMVEMSAKLAPPKEAVAQSLESKSDATAPQFSAGSASAAGSAGTKVPPGFAQSFVPPGSSPAQGSDTAPAATATSSTPLLEEHRENSSDDNNTSRRCPISCTVM